MKHFSQPRRFRDLLPPSVRRHFIPLSSDVHIINQTDGKGRYKKRPGAVSHWLIQDNE